MKKGDYNRKKISKETEARARLITRTFIFVVIEKKSRIMLSSTRNVENMNIEKNKGVIMDGGIKARYNKIHN